VSSCFHLSCPRARPPSSRSSSYASFPPSQLLPVTVILCILSIPGALTLYVQYRAYVDRWDAAARGEILPPEMKASFGGVSTVLRSVEDLATGFPADALGQRCEDLGNTYGIRIAFKNRVRRSLV
jgi:hypothetical protein